VAIAKKVASPERLSLPTDIIAVKALGIQHPKKAPTGVRAFHSFFRRRLQLTSRVILLLNPHRKKLQRL
jgi:hypothetical protein